MKRLIKLLTFIFLILAPPVYAQDSGYLVATNCAALSPVANNSICLQSTTVGGLTAGILYSYTSLGWVPVGTASTGAGHTIKDEAGAALTARTNLNFTGDLVLATDNSGTNSTDVTIATPWSSFTNHGVLIGAGNKTTINTTAAGTAGQCLTSNGASADPTFQACGVNVASNFVWTGTHTFQRTKFSILDTGDPTKILQFDPSGFTTGTTRTWSGPNATTRLWGDSDFATTGLMTRTASGTGAGRTITGVSGETVITNGDGVAGNPTIGTGADVIKRNQANTYSGGGLQDMTANLLTLPQSAAYAPTNEGRIGVNTTTHKGVIGLNGATQTLAVESGNIATATALAADPVGCTLANGEWTNDINTIGNSTCARINSTQSSAPAPATVRFAGELNKDSRTYACATHAGLTYVGSAASGSFAAIASEADGYTTYSDGVSTAIPCGADTLVMRGSGGINFDAYTFSATFTSQPTNDGWEAVSSNAGDTTQFLKVCGLLTGGDSKDLTCETIQLNGTTQIASVTATYATVETVRICSTSACVANTTAAGTVTVRKASNNATITTIAAGSSKSANQSMYVVTLTSSLNINSLTTDSAPDVTADFVPTYDNSAGSNKKVLLENVGTQQVYFDAGAISTDATNCGAPTEQTLNSGPKTWAFSCADSGSSIFYGKMALPVAITTATFTLDLFHGTTETITFAGSFDAQCRAAGTAVNATWGTSQTANVAITTANQVASATTATLTPNGTCSKGAMLFWRYVVNAAAFDTNAANAKVLGVMMKYQK